MALFRQLKAGELPTLREWNLLVRMVENIISQVPGMRVDYSEPGQIGLIKDAESGDDSSAITADDLWIEIEDLPDGHQVNHKPPPSPPSPVGFTFYAAASSGGSPTVKYEVDSRGHIATEDDSGLPPVENYRYIHCDLSAGDLIFATDEGAVIVVADECYYRADQTTSEAATNPVPTVAAVYDDCEACAAGTAQYVDIIITDPPAGSDYPAGEYTLTGQGSQPYQYWTYTDGVSASILMVQIDGANLDGGEVEFGVQWHWGRYDPAEPGYIGMLTDDTEPYFTPTLSPAGGVEIVNWHN